MPAAPTIIAGIDFSPGSAAALAQAIRIAKAEGVALALLHTLPRLVVTDLADALGRDAPELEVELIADARRQLQEMLPPDIDAALVAIEVVVGTPVKEMIEAVRRRRPDLLVLGVTGASGAGGGAGTFATRCIRRASSNVLLVHEGRAGAFRTIVVGVDFSGTSKRALAEAIAFARRDGSELHVLHVYDGPWHRLHYRAPTREASPAFQRQYMQRLQRLLDAFVEPFASELEGITCLARLHEHPSHGCGIIEYAETRGADLIVVGTLGATNVRSMLLGSTAERVLRETMCSVLTIRARHGS